METIEFCYTQGCHCHKHHNGNPRFSTPCTYGAWCRRPNCYYTHPSERVLPPHDPTPCPDSSTCSNAFCNLLHPEKTLLPYIPRHPPTAPIPRRCKYGAACTPMQFCPYDHRLLDEVCPTVGPCPKGRCCWYAHHTLYNGVIHGGIPSQYFRREDIYNVVDGPR